MIQKTKKELERKIKFWRKDSRFWQILWVITICLAVFILFMSIRDINNLKHENQELKFLVNSECDALHKSVELNNLLLDKWVKNENITISKSLKQIVNVDCSKIKDLTK